MTLTFSQGQKGLRIFVPSMMPVSVIVTTVDTTVQLVYYMKHRSVDLRTLSQLIFFYHNFLLNNLFFTPPRNRGRGYIFTAVCLCICLYVC